MPESGLKRAAVLVPICRVGGEYFLLFIKRAQGAQHHGGEISFPGGTAQEGERSPEKTALRESWEEIGLKPEDVTLLGPLDDVETHVSGYAITPYVGLVLHPHPFRLEEKEVAELIHVPLTHLLERGRRAEYEYGGHIIWGATARILGSLLNLLTSSPEGHS